MKNLWPLFLLIVTLSCQEEKPTAQWFKELKEDQSQIDLENIIFSPYDLHSAFANLKEGVYGDTLLMNNFSPVLQFEYYDLPQGPGYIFNMRCGEQIREGVICFPVKGGCKCIGAKDPVDKLQPEITRYCELTKEKFLAKWFCEGNCKEEGRTCFPLMLFQDSTKKSGGVAGCLCLPLR